MNTDAQVPTYPVCGIPIAALKPDQAARTIVEAAASGQPLEVHLCNAYTLSLVDRDMELRSALRRSNLNLPDGTPVAWLGRNYGTSGPVRGPSLVGDVARLGIPDGVKHYFYGGAEGVSKAMAEGLTQHALGLAVAGAETPPFRRLDDDELDELASRILGTGATLVWVGIGTPRQDYLVPRLAERLAMPIIPVGAAFDFWSGAVPEAPSWIQGSGLEWAYRLVSEPRRLWRRYLLGNPLFVWSTFKHRWQR